MQQTAIAQGVATAAGVDSNTLVLNFLHLNIKTMFISNFKDGTLIPNISLAFSLSCMVFLVFQFSKSATSVQLDFKCLQSLMGISFTTKIKLPNLPIIQLL
jgi:hypothetical protein